MNTKVKWSILILTQPSRRLFLQGLFSMLGPQVAAWNDQDSSVHAELNIKEFDKSASLGENRQRMIDAAEGEYVNFVDDDDLVSEDYVATIAPLLDGKVDYVGFQLQCYVDGKPLAPTYHSLRYKEWRDEPAVGYFRDISHLNPIRRSLALKAWMSGGHGEDRRWAEELRRQGIVKTESYVDSIMYHYLVRTVKNDDVVPEIVLRKKEECRAATA